MKSPGEKKIIGRRESVDFPELGLIGITAKIDTGAYTAALHCQSISVKEIDGKPTLCFIPLQPDHAGYTGVEQRITEFRQKGIKSSFGETEIRYLIKTKVRIARKTINSIISLSDRGTMRYPLLIGRRLLKRKFIVDVSEVNLWQKK